MVTLVAVVLALTVLPAPWGAIAILSALAFDLAETAILVRWSKRRRAAVGVEGLVGRTAVVVRALTPGGQVKLDGELWEARSAEPAQPGDQVVVRGVDGLVLEVDRAH